MGADIFLMPNVWLPPEILAQQKISNGLRLKAAMAEEDLLRLISELQSNCHHQWKKIMICERGKKIVKHYECLNCRKVKPAKWQLGTNVCKRCDGELELIGFDFLRPRDRAVYRCKDCGWQ